MKTPSFLLDLVHHNPGEPPLQTRFVDPSFLAELGYGGQVLKHLNASVALSPFPATEEERVWLERAQAARDSEIAAAKRAGLRVYYHVDLFLLPKGVIEANRGEICDAKGRIDVTRPATLELHRTLFDEMFCRYPDVDGLVIRVGECYLFDTPHHAGNTAVPLHDPEISREEQVRRFKLLVEFLRNEICVRHRKTLIYRTWDYFGDRFHADPAFYLAVTDAIEPHANLVFSIKHTAGDFFRGCVPNPCIGIGRHPQIVEVQCQREYEGKGAFPNYVIRGVVDGFPEVPQPKGLSEWIGNPLFDGLWTWSRGGGWFGPYLKHEFWPELNVRVLLEWYRNPAAGEHEAFDRVCAERFGMNAESRAAFRSLCLTAEEAVWLGRSIPALARLRNFTEADSGRLWMRDDRLGGIDRLKSAFEELESAGMLDEALEEKRRAARLFQEMAEQSAFISCRSPKDTDTLRASAVYGARLFEAIALGWEILIRRWRAARGCGAPVRDVEVNAFREAWRRYEATLEEHPLAATLYLPHGWAWPGQTPSPGLEASVLGIGSP